MATIAPSTPNHAVTYQAAVGGGDKYLNHGTEKLHVRNGGGSDITVHLAKTGTCNYGQTHAADTSDTHTVPAGEDLLLGAVDPNIYNDGSNFVIVTYSGVTSVTVGVIG